MAVKLLPRRFMRRPDGVVIKLLEGGDDEAHWTEYEDWRCMHVLRYDYKNIVIYDYEGQGSEPDFDPCAPEHCWESLPGYPWLSQYGYVAMLDERNCEQPFPLLYSTEDNKSILAVDCIGVRGKSDPKHGSMFGLDAHVLCEKIPPLSNEDPEILEFLARDIAEAEGAETVSLYRFGYAIGACDDEPTLADEANGIEPIVYHF